MKVPHRFATLRIGELSVTTASSEFVVETRILSDSDGHYWVFAGALSEEPFASLEEAVAWAEKPEPRPPDASCLMHWRATNAPLPPRDHACPICGMPSNWSQRYPRQLCPICVLEATDAQNRPLRFANTHMSGGFTALYADDKTPYAGHECLVRGIRCHADEHRFGGIVLQPLTAAQKLGSRQ